MAFINPGEGVISPLDYEDDGRYCRTSYEPDEYDYYSSGLKESKIISWVPDRLMEPFERRFISPEPFAFIQPQDCDDDEIYLNEWIDRAAEILVEYKITGFTDEDFDLEIFGLESGDDRCDTSRSPVGLALCLSGQEQILKMKTSEKDTFISNWLYNYCEIISSQPNDPVQGFDAWRKGRHTNLGFVDLSRMRSIMDSYSGNNPHASRKGGKAGMHGRSTEHANDEIRPIQQLSQFLQCGMCLTERNPEPTYLPKELGGSGAPALFNNPANLYLSVLTMRGASQSRVYGSGVNEARRAVYDMDLGRACFTPLLDKLRLKQEYLHATYAEKVLIQPSEMRNPDLYKIARPVIKAGAITGYQMAVIQRLQSAKVLVSESGANLEINKTNRLNDYIFGELTYEENEKIQHSEMQRKRIIAGGSMYANCNVARLLNKAGTTEDVKALQNAGFMTSFAGVREFTRDQADWVFDGCKGETCTIKDLLRIEDQFLMSEVSSETRLKVPGIPLVSKTIHRAPKLRETSTNVGLWQVPEDTQIWAQKVGESLRDHRDSGDPHNFSRIFWLNREIVSDDMLIVEHVKTLTERKVNVHIVLVTDDKRLCSQVVRMTGVIVHRMRPHTFAHSVEEGYDFSASNLELFDEKRVLVNVSFWSHKRKEVAPSHVIVDTGSLAAALSIMGQVAVPDGYQAYPEAKTFGRHPDGSRKAVIYWKFSQLPKGKFAIKETFRPTR